MKKSFISAIIFTLIFGTCMPVNAKNSFADELNKKLQDVGKAVNIEKTAEKITSSAKSAAANISKNTGKIVSNIESQIDAELKWLTGAGGARVQSIAKENLPKVIDKLRAEVQKAPKDKKLLIRLAVAYKFGGKYSLALLAAEKILTMDPNSKEAAIIKAECYKLQGQTRKAIAYLEEFLKKNSSATNVKAYLGQLKSELSLKEKEYYLEQNIKASPRNFAQYSEMSKIYASEGQKGVKLFVNGKKVNYLIHGNVQPIYKNGRVLIPLSLMESICGSKPVYNVKAATITISTGGKKVIFSKNKNTVNVNSKDIKLVQPIEVINGKTYLPVKYVSEYLGKEVRWYPYSVYGIVAINDKVPLN